MHVEFVTILGLLNIQPALDGDKCLTAGFAWGLFYNAQYDRHRRFIAKKH